MKRDNTPKVLGKSNLHYGETHRQFAAYLARASEDVNRGAAHIKFHQRGKVTQATLRARALGEPCTDQDEGFLWLLDLSSRLKLGQDCGKIQMVPNGNTTKITVTNS